MFKLPKTKPPGDNLKASNVAAPDTKEYPAIWLQAAGCSGCSVSLLNIINPSIKNLLIDEVLPGSHINLRFHSTVMAGAGEPAIEVIIDTSRKKKGGSILIVEGAIPTAKGDIHGVIGEKDGKPMTMQSWVETLAKDALAVITLGSCAAFGGIPAAKPNPTQFDGPCGGSQGGKCEVYPDIPCVWQQIIDQFIKLDQLDKLERLVAPKNWSVSLTSGPPVKRLS